MVRKARSKSARPSLMASSDITSSLPVGDRTAFKLLFAFALSTTPPRGRSDAVVAGWGFLALLNIETFANRVALSGPESLSLPTSMFAFLGCLQR